MSPVKLGELLVPVGLKLKPVHLTLLLQVPLLDKLLLVRFKAIEKVLSMVSPADPSKKER